MCIPQWIIVTTTDTLFIEQHIFSFDRRSSTRYDILWIQNCSLCMKNSIGSFRTIQSKVFVLKCFFAGHLLTWLTDFSCLVTDISQTYEWVEHQWSFALLMNRHRPYYRGSVADQPFLLGSLMFRSHRSLTNVLHDTMAYSRGVKWERTCIIPSLFCSFLNMLSVALACVRLKFLAHGHHSYNGNLFSQLFMKLCQILNLFNISRSIASTQDIQASWMVP